MIKEEEKQIKIGDLIETVFGNHLGIVIDKDDPDKDWYVVHLFGGHDKQYFRSKRLRKIS
jgi:hypothetical protein